MRFLYSFNHLVPLFLYIYDRLAEDILDEALCVCCNEMNSFVDEFVENLFEEEFQPT